MQLAERLATATLLPVLGFDNPESARLTAGALARAGYQALEVTLRTGAAIDCMAAIHRAEPALLLGAGTVVEPRQLALARRAGAVFCVSPGVTPALAEAARDLARADPGWSFVPGVQTVSEAMAAAEAGWRFQKLFPARACGGEAWLRAVRGPLPDLRFCATGGLDGAAAAAYLGLPNVACVGGSWMVPEAAVAAGDWHAVERAAAAALAAARRVARPDVRPNL